MWSIEWHIYISPRESNRTSSGVIYGVILSLIAESLLLLVINSWGFGICAEGTFWDLYLFCFFGRGEGCVFVFVFVYWYLAFFCLFFIVFCLFFWYFCFLLFFVFYSFLWYCFLVFFLILGGYVFLLVCLFISFLFTIMSEVLSVWSYRKTRWNFPFRVYILS